MRWLFEDVEQLLRAIDQVTLGITRLFQGSKTLQSFDGALCHCKNTDRCFHKSTKSKIELAPICVVKNKSGCCFRHTAF